MTVRINNAIVEGVIPKEREKKTKQEPLICTECGSTVTLLYTSQPQVIPVSFMDTTIKFMMYCAVRVLGGYRFLQTVPQNTFLILVCWSDLFPGQSWEESLLLQCVCNSLDKKGPPQVSPL